MRHFFAVPQESYVDDFCTIDFQINGGDHGAAQALKAMMGMIGFELEPGKHQKPHTVNTFLGVEVDLTHANKSADPYVEFRPSAGRTTRILGMLDVAAVEGLSSHTAQVIQGKLRWILQAAWGSVARAAIQPLMTRANHFDVGTGWNSRLHSMTSFLRTLFRHLPPLRWHLAGPRRLPVHVYTDAQYSNNGRKGMGVLLHDPHTHQTLISGALVPDEILTWIHQQRGDLLQQINQCELLAVAAAIMTFPDILAERDVVFWIDNVTALKCCVNGYSRYPDLASMSNAIQLLMAGIRARGYYMHVPGLANPADIPSRVPFVSGPKGPHLDPTLLQKQKGDVETMEGIHAHSAPTYRALVVPSASELDNAESFIQFGRGWP
jgi:hypothetical protein